MNGEIQAEAADTLGALRVVPPGYAAHTRAGLAPAVRRKLDLLESDALNKLALTRAASDRVVEVRAEVVAVQQRIAAMLESAGAYRHVDLTNERAELADAEERVGKLAAERDAAQARWQAAARLLESCKAFLNLR